jgi:hypothetical protein
LVKPQKDAIQVNDENKYDHIMKQLDDFDIKFETLGKSTDNRLLRDNLSATAFVKEVN